MVGQAKTFQPLPIGAPTPDGYYVLQVLNGIPQWDVASGGGGGGFIAAGDLSGSSSDQTVVGLQGRPIANVMVSAGQIYVYNGHQWVPQNAPSGSFTAGNDLSGTSSSQTVQGIYNHAVASTAPVNLAVPIYDTALSQYDIRQLTLDDLAAAFSITSFTGGSTVECGATVSNPSFTASYSTPASSAQITNTDSIDSPHVLSSPYTSATITGSFHHTTVNSSVTFTLTAVAATTKTATSAITYQARSFGGPGTAGATSSVTASGSTAILSTGDVLANEGLHSSDVGQIYGPFTPSAQKIYLLLVGGSHTFKDSNTGFAFVFNTPTSVSFTNQNGAVISMFLYESSSTLTGTFSILVNT